MTTPATIERATARVRAGTTGPDGTTPFAASVILQVWNESDAPAADRLTDALATAGRLAHLQEAA